MRRGRFRFVYAIGLGAVIAPVAIAGPTNGDPRIRLEASDQAQAKKVVLRSRDFPSAWTYQPIALRGVSFQASCSGLAVDLARLVLTGETGSRGSRSYGSSLRQDVVSEAFLFATPGQARTIQARLPSAFMGGCIGRSGTRDGHGGHIDSVSRLDVKARGVDVIAYRVVTSAGNVSTYGDYLFLQAHRVWATIFYVSTPQAPALDAKLLAAVAARMR